jgi:hypothetical protein
MGTPSGPQNGQLGRPTRWLKGGLLLLLFGSLFGLSALLVIYVSLRGRAVSVPNLILMKESSAQDELEGVGLIMQVRARSPHQQVPFGAVADQSPAPGSVVKTGQIVRVTLSLGAPRSESARNEAGWMDQFGVDPRARSGNANTLPPARPGRQTVPPTP